MINLRGMIILSLFLSGDARRSFRIEDSRHDAQQQIKTLSKDFKVSAEGKDALLPTGLKPMRFRTGALPQTLPKFPSDKMNLGYMSEGNAKNVGIGEPGSPRTSEPATLMALGKPMIEALLQPDRSSFQKPLQGSQLLKTPRVFKIYDKPYAFQLLDYEIQTVPGVRGVHARKLATLCGYEGSSPLCETPRFPLPAQKPKWTPEATEAGLVSCGGLLARGGAAVLPPLARVCAARGSTLTYHTPPLPDWLRDEPSGNLAAALATGCLKLVEHESIASYNQAWRSFEGQPNFVPQGGEWAAAEPGIAALGRAIGEWWLTRPGGGLDVPARLPSDGRGLDVVLPAGTGTTALFLARHVPPGVTVYAVPCKGDAEQLTKRMQYLDERSGGVGVLPQVLEPPSSHTHKFGAVSASLLAAWRDAAERGVLLDLHYGPVAWAALDACGWRPGGGKYAGREVLYVNMGGHETLESQMLRYQRAGHLRKFEQGRQGKKRCIGMWEPEEVVSDAKRLAAKATRLIHTRDAGL